MDVMDEGAIAVSQLCKLLDRIKEKLLSMKLKPTTTEKQKEKP